MFCATLEYLFPRPIPFFRLGLANLPIILAFPLLDFSSMLLLALLKVMGQGLVNGTLASYVFLLSFAGSFASLMVMYLLFKIMRSKISYIGLSLAGALASNSVQSLFSVFFIFGDQAWVILPLFYGLGFVAGLVIGVFAELFSRRSYWFYLRYIEKGILERSRLSIHSDLGPKTVEQNPVTRLSLAATNANDNNEPPQKDIKRRAHTKKIHIILPLPKNREMRKRKKGPIAFSFLKRNLSTPAAFFTGLLVLPGYLAVSEPLPRLIQLLVLGMLTLASGKRLLYTYFLFLLFSLILFHSMIPQGRVLVEIGRFALTEGALLSGLYRGMTIIGFVFISLFSIRKDLKIPGTFGRLIADMLKNFEHIYEYKNSARLAGIIKRLDRILFELEDMRDPGADAYDETVRKNKPNVARDVLISLAIILVLYAPFAWEHALAKLYS